MNDWVLALTSLTALAALTTVILAASSVSSGERAARAGERAVEQARLESKNRHYQEMIFQVQQLHIFKNSGYTIGHPDWYIPRNRLQVLTIGIDEDIPQTNEILMCSMPRAAPTEASQLE